jgi:hypothetical protein
MPAAEQTIRQKIKDAEEGRGIRVKGKGGKSYRTRTTAELAEVKAEHEARVGEALDALATEEGMAAYLVAELLHTKAPLSPGNLALAAYQAPGQIVAGYWQWVKAYGARVGKGCTHNVKLTGGKNLPVANWSSDLLGYPLGDVPAPDADTCRLLAESWAAWPDRSLAGVRAWAADVEPAFIEGVGTYRAKAEPAPYVFDGSDIPF